MKKIAILLVVLSALFGAGCSSTAIVPSAFEIRGPMTIPKIPLRAALYLPPRFKNNAFIGNKGGARSQERVIFVGDAMTSGAERSLRSLFQYLVIVEDVNSDQVWREVDVIVTPEIVDTENWLVPRFSLNLTWESRIVCKWTINKSQGKLLFMDTITGVGHYEAYASAFTLSEQAGKSMVPAVQDHYNNLVDRLLSLKWWEEVQ